MAMAPSNEASQASTGQDNHNSHIGRPRRFAPLGFSKADGSDCARLRGIVFDVDGTLCLPQNHMFQEMRAVLNIPKSVDILEHIQSLSTVPDNPASSSNQMTSPRERAVEAVRTIERRAMVEQQPQPGLAELMSYLQQRSVDPQTNLKIALCTRNFPAPVDHLLDNFLSAQQREMLYPIITRDTVNVRPKPSPEGLWYIAETWGVVDELDTGDIVQRGGSKDILQVGREYLGSGIIMVGDSIDDMAAGYRAGAATVLLINDFNMHLKDHEYTDLCIERLDELIRILDEGFVGRS